jgi:periplasmic mercuric ion binding protein
MKISFAGITCLILAAGLSLASEADKTVTFEVERMTCATCPIAVRKAMHRVDGVKNVEVSLENKSAVVTFDPNATTVVEIGRASADVGFPVTVRGRE